MNYLIILASNLEKNTN